MTSPYFMWRGALYCVTVAAVINPRAVIDAVHGIVQPLANYLWVVGAVVEQAAAR